MATLAYGDIQTMTGTSSRGKNDFSNKKRETILTQLLNLDSSYFEDEEYGSQWAALKVKWSDLLSRICEVPYTNVMVEPKAGRGHHYDFHITYKKDEHTIREKKVEFKHHCSSIARLPQFLSLSAKQDFLMDAPPYAEEYYDHFIDRYLACDSEITIAKPTKEEYLKMVYTTNYDIHPFFRCLYDRSKFYEKEKNAVVNESIRTYLTKYMDRIDLDKLSEKFQNTQTDKIFVMWDLKQFHTEQFDEQELKLLTNEGVYRGNVLVLKSKTCIFHMLLRWRNHKGVLLPAWQISLKQHKRSTSTI